MSDHKEKLCRLLSVIYKARDEITAVTKSGREYYFAFRGRVFSVSGAGGDVSPGFFVYPKWQGTPSDLVSAFAGGYESADTAFVFIPAKDAQDYLGEPLVRELHSWIDSKDMGLDALFSEFGID